MSLSEGAKGAEPPPNLKMGKKHYTGRGAALDDAGISCLQKYFNLLKDCSQHTQASFAHDRVDLVAAMTELKWRCAHAGNFDAGCKIIFIGNGGSSAISSHMATDFSKNGGMRAIAFNDAPTLTCLGNDFGIDEIFAKQLEFYALPGDLVIIVSSSGKSKNILRAAEQAFEMGLDLVTFSGMNPNNVLREKGLLSFYVPAKDYGLVEMTHLALLHSILSVQGAM
jgi:D-sedoheptulose 7-phosphate isomerase